MLIRFPTGLAIISIGGIAFSSFTSNYTIFTTASSRKKRQGPQTFRSEPCTALPKLSGRLSTHRGVRWVLYQNFPWLWASIFKKRKTPPSSLHLFAQFSPVPHPFHTVVSSSHHVFATLFAETPRNFGTPSSDAPTIEYTPISTIRASGSRRRFYRISSCSLTVKVQNEKYGRSRTGLMFRPPAPSRRTSLRRQASPSRGSAGSYALRRGSGR